MTLRDPISIWNERVKLFAGFLNALGVGMVGFSILRPVIETQAVPESYSWLWGAAGIAMHLMAHYVIGRLKKDPTT